MPRTAKISLWALGVLTVLMTGFYIYLRWDNYNVLRGIITSRVQEATGQQLTFNGPISLEMGADSFLRFSDVVLTNPDWQFLRSTITVDEGRIGLDVPNVIAGGIGTVVQLNTVKVTLDRPDGAKTIPDAPAPGAALSGPLRPPLPKFDELRVDRLIVIGDSVLGGRILQLEDLKVVPETLERTRVEAQSANQSDVTVTIVTDEIEDGRAWSVAIKSPRSDAQATLEATSGRKLFLRGLAVGESLDLGDVASILPPIQQADAVSAQGKAFLTAQADLPIGWLQLITANFDMRIAHITGAAIDLRNVRLEGRAEGGWISIAPIEAAGQAGVARGFAILDASSFPVTSEVSMQMRSFSPFGASNGEIDATVSLSSEGRDLDSLYAVNGSVASFFQDFSDATAMYPALLTPILSDVFASAPRDVAFPIECGIAQFAIRKGRSQRATSQIFGSRGRLAMRGAFDFMGGPMDLDIAAEPLGADVAYFDAIGALWAPAVSKNSRAAPWLTLSQPRDSMCDMLREQSQASLSGR